MRRSIPVPAWIAYLFWVLLVPTLAFGLLVLVACAFPEGT